MSFGKATGGLRRERRTAGVLADPARLELLDPAVIGDLLAPVAGMGASAEARTIDLLERALMQRELARRSGDAASLAEAMRLAERAARLSGDGGRLFAAARLQQALCAFLRTELLLDPAGAAAARTYLADAERALGCAPGRLNGPGLIRARLMAHDALAEGDRNKAMDAAAVFDEAITALDARVRATGQGEQQRAAARCERSEMMIGLGERLKDAGLLDRAARDLAKTTATLDPAYLPLSWVRCETLRGTALRALGEITGEARLLKDAAAALHGAMEAIPAGYSPLDRARASHGLGLALHAWTEATGEPKANASALAAFDWALSEIRFRGLPLWSVVLHDRAACVARQAERAGDTRALEQAEATFKGQLAAKGGDADPVAWAVTQMALARIYEARAELQGDKGERAHAAFALAEALEVFSERGLKSLSDLCAAALDRLRAAR